jgi:hypothetical protein
VLLVPKPGAPGSPGPQKACRPRAAKPPALKAGGAATLLKCGRPPAPTLPNPPPPPKPPALSADPDEVCMQELYASDTGCKQGTLGSSHLYYRQYYTDACCQRSLFVLLASQGGGVQMHT